MIFVSLVGLTLIFVRSTIFRPLQRVWPALFQCSQCVGMWVGSAAGATGIAQIQLPELPAAYRVLAPLEHSPIVDAVLVGAAVSVLSLAADAVLLKLLGDPSDTKTTQEEIGEVPCDVG